MSDNLENYYISNLTPAIISSQDHARFIKRVKQKKLTRGQNPLSHTCAMILAFDPETKEVLLIHHKKAKSWLFPGGHVDLGEIPSETVRREAEEELGLVNVKKLIGPFGAQILDIDNHPQICKEHYDIFYAIPVLPSEIIVDMREFISYEWLPVDKAREKIALEYYRQALDTFIRFMKW